MTKRTIISLALWAALAAAGASLAKPLSYMLPDETGAFRPSPGVEAAQNNCASCHSADYINFQPPNRGQAFWDAEVQKMIKVYHAPIDEKDAKTITDYLAKTY
jgi:mono/diheme cytochrome c family protein